MITRRSISAFATALLLLGTIAAQASPSAAAVDCAQTNANADLLVKIPEFIGITLDPGAVGPGSAGPGHRLENGAAICWANYQRPVHCEVGAQGFVLDGQYGTLE